MRFLARKTTHRYDMGCLFFLLLYLTAGQVASGQQVEYRTLGMETIEQRLLLAPDKNKERRTVLLRLFEEGGCKSDSMGEQRVKGADFPNIICTLPGESDTIIVIGAHFDKIEIGKGVVDNWSGASMLPSLFESLSTRPRRHTLVFIGFSGEERGLIGSDYYVKKLVKEKMTRIFAMVNLDSLGMTSTKVEYSSSDRKLVNLLMQVARRLNLPLSAVDIDWRIGRSDADSFLMRKIPSITIHSVTSETLRILHSTWDNPKAIKMADYYDTYRLIAAYVAALDTILN